MLHYLVSHNVKSVFPIIGLSLFSSALGLGIIAPLLPIYSETLGASGLWVGIIFAGYSIARTLLQPFAGEINDRHGRKLMLSIGLFALALTSFAYVLADNVISLLIIRLLQGAATCMVQPVAQAYVGDLAPKGEEGKWMGYLNGTFFLGWGAGPLMGGLFADYFGMDIAFYAMGGLNAAAFLGVVLFLPEIKHSRLTGKGGFSFLNALRSRGTGGLFIYHTGLNVQRSTTVSFMPLFGALVLGLRPSLVGTILTIVVMGAAPVQAFSGRMADRFNRRRIVVIASLVMMVAVALVPSAKSFWVLLAFMAIVTISDSISLPTATAMVVDEGRRYGMGMAMAVFNMGLGLGQSIGPILAGLMTDWLGIGYSFYAAAIVVLVCTIAFSPLTRPGQK